MSRTANGRGASGPMLQGPWTFESRNPDSQESRAQQLCLDQGKWCPVKKQLVAGFLSPLLPQTTLPGQGAIPRDPQNLSLPRTTLCTWYEWEKQLKVFVPGREERHGLGLSGDVPASLGN